ncbi:MAG TPA: thermonuclease family protein [Xanthobacteraceae bacterium]|nr:thermonuclease family protein [Xanthobacteraceae bacterium]
MRGRRGVLGIAAVAAALSCIGNFPVHAQRAAKKAVAALPCGGEEIARGSVGRVLDGRTFVLGDGREVRLAGIETASLSAGASDGPAGDTAARDALAKLIADAQVVLRKAEFASDRYGRVSAYVDVVQPSPQRSVQAELLASGFARVGDMVGEGDCAAELLRRENAARSAKLGLWADPYYDPLPADKPAEILARRGRFALVEGEVVSVHPSGATLYVNFGRRWSEDFAVTIRKRNERKFTTAGVDPHGLSGHRVRVRGWIEARGGIAGSPWRAPWIEAARPEQIETVGRNDARVAR